MAPTWAVPGLLVLSKNNVIELDFELQRLCFQLVHQLEGPGFILIQKRAHQTYP